MTVLAKSLGSRIDFSLDWRDWLSDNETLTTVTWRVDPAEPGGLTLDGTVDAGLVQGVFVRGGEPLKIYRLICTATTSEGREVERGLSIKVMER